MRLSVILAIGSFPILASACMTSGADPGYSKLRGDEPQTIAWLPSLATEDDYQKLIRNDTATRETYVKITVDHKVDGIPVYFQNTSKYPFHQKFLSENIERFRGRTFTMDDILFGPTKEISGGAIYWARDLQLAGFSEPGVLGFYIYFQNDVNIDEIVTVYNRLKATVPFGAGKLAYLFSSLEQYTANKKLLKAKNIPSLRISAITGRGETTTVYSAAKSYGYLKAIKPEAFEAGDYTSKDILVLDQVPIDVGPLAGIITTEAQVPHSHVIFRAINQKIPDVYLPNALSVEMVSKNLGKLVEMTTTEAGEVAIKGLDEVTGLEDLAEQYFVGRIPKLPELKANFDERNLLAWKGIEVNREHVLAYGTKGTNFAIIDRALRAAGYDRSLYEGSFLVPLHYYVQHVGQKLTEKICKKAKNECVEDSFDEPTCQKAADNCTALLATGKTLADFLRQMTAPEHVAKMVAENLYRKAYLAYAQEVIKRANLDTIFADALRGMIRRTYPDTLRIRIRLRSSTNAEDLPGLNGAGFYISKAACLADGDGDGGSEGSACRTEIERQRTLALIARLEGDTDPRTQAVVAELRKDLTEKKPLDTAVKKVFASIWTEKAFLNRDYYRIAHMGVAMAMLVHPSYSDERANGVIIAQETSAGDLEVNFVVQKDDIAVTNPEIRGATPDQVVIIRKADGTLSDPRFILRNNQNGGQPVMTPEQMHDLVQQVRVAREAVRAVYGPEYGQPRLDLEFKVDGQGKVHLRQVRPL